MNECLKKLTCNMVHVMADDLLRSDFRNFAHFIWSQVLNFSKPSPLQYDIADYMQECPVSEDGKARGQIQSLRGAGKSWLICVFIVWLLYCNPDLKIAVMCSKIDFGQRAIKFIRGLLHHELLVHLVPLKATDNKWENYRKDMLDNLDEFGCGAITQHSSEPSVKAFGIFGTFTGIHPDIVIADDVEVPENSGTAKKREKIHEKCKEFESLVNPGGMVLFLGTPQTEESIYNEKLDQRYVCRRWPCRYPDPADKSACLNIAPWLLDNMRTGLANPGDLTYPERFDDQELLVKEAIEGTQMFALQYMLDPSLSDADRYPLKLSNLVVFDAAYDMAPSQVVWGTAKPVTWLDSVGLQGDSFYEAAWASDEFLPYQMSVMYIDPAGRGGDSVAYAVAKALNGQVFISAAGGLAGKKGQDGAADAVLEKLAKIAFVNGVKKVIVEKNFGDGMYTKLLAPIMARICGPVAMEEVNSVGQKECRIIDVLQPLTQSKRLIIGHDVAKNDELWKQYTRLTRERGCLSHDDEVEALAGACSAVSEVVQIDPVKADSDRKAAAKRNMALEFQQSVQRGVTKDGRKVFYSGRMPTIDEQLAERDRLNRHRRRMGWQGGPRGTRGWANQ